MTTFSSEPISFQTHDAIREQQLQDARNQTITRLFKQAELRDQTQSYWKYLCRVVRSKYNPNEERRKGKR